LVNQYYTENNDLPVIQPLHITAILCFLQSTSGVFLVKKNIQLFIRIKVVLCISPQLDIPCTIAVKRYCAKMRHLLRIGDAEAKKDLQQSSWCLFSYSELATKIVSSRSGKTFVDHLNGVLNFLTSFESDRLTGRQDRN